MRFHFGRRSLDTAQRPASLASRIGGSLFFAFFLGMGLLFVGLGLRSVGETLALRRWPAVSCEILESSVDTQGDRYGVNVRYRYAVEGETFTSVRHRAPATRESDYAKAQRVVDRYRPGTTSTCYVDPRDSGKAVLERPGLGVMFVVPFALIFVAVGAIGLYSIWRKPKAPPSHAPATPQQTRELGGKAAKALLALFLLIGLVATYFFTAPLFTNVYRARDWPPTPAVVVSSRVQTHRSDDGTTYRVDILYEYRVGGQTYRSNRYGFMGGSSSGYEGKADIVRQHPPGKPIVCYVDPRDPTRAVLERGFQPIMLVSLIPVVFVLVGGAGLAGLFRTGRRAAAIPARATGPVILKTTSPLAKAAGMLLVALFWNGIVSVFVSEAVRGWQRGRPDYMLSIFMIPFVVVGLGFVASIFYFLLASRNPRPTLRLSADTAAPGDTLQLDWQFDSRRRLIERLSIELENREEITTGTGKNRSTQRNVLQTIPVADISRAPDILTGRAVVMLPPDARPTVNEGNHRLLWVLRFRGEIANWPDVQEEHPLLVRRQRP